MSLHARFRPLIAFIFACAALAQVPAARAQADAAAAVDPAALETLVGPVALYPDDLLSILLPASTFPLQIVEADRWVKENKGKKDAKPKDGWDDSVKALINYPDVIQKMNTDLEWTAALGEAVVADQTAVMDAVQAFRRKADGAGNLKTDDKQTVIVEEEVVKIVQTDPEVIYVPQYEPTTVVVQQSAPYPYSYYPSAYPCYYCTYPPGYAFASGFFWGAATAYAFNWFDGGIHNDIDIDIDRDVNRNSNRNVNRNTDRATNIDRGRANQMKQSGRTGWKSSQRPGQVSRGGQARSTASASNRMGDRGGAGASNRAAGGAGASNRAAGGANRGSAGASNRAAGTGSRPSTGASTANRGAGAASRGGSSGGISLPSSMQGSRSSSSYGGSRGSSSYGGGSYGNASRYSGSARSSSPSRSAYSGMSSGRSSGAYSSRGSASRGSMGGGGGRGGGGGGRRR